MSRVQSLWPADGFAPCVDCAFEWDINCRCDKEPPTPYIHPIRGYISWPNCGDVRGTSWCSFKCAETHLTPAENKKRINYGCY